MFEFTVTALNRESKSHFFLAFLASGSLCDFLTNKKS